MLASGALKAEEAASACLERIAQTEPRLKALLTVDAEGALARARALDAGGPDPAKPLWGVPVTVKDCFSTKGLRTTAASRMLENYVPFYDAGVVNRLREAGAVILGKNNMDEFAMGASTENSAFQPTANPWNLEHSPGGSSGGSAASVAACQCFASMGSDTGGSIRQPASFCGCVGMKPTYGRVSRYGVIAYGSSLDQAGPITRNVADCAAMLQVVAGHDPRDATSANLPVDDYMAAIGSMVDLKGVRLAVPEEFFGKGLSPEVDAACKQALSKSESLGAELVPMAFPHAPASIAAYYIVAMAEASSNLARFDGIRYGHRSENIQDLAELYVRSRSEAFGEEVKRRIMLGTYVLSSGYYDAYYKKAAQVRRLIQADYLKALETCHAVLCPAAPVTAWKTGSLGDDPLRIYLMDMFTLSLNLSGLPGICLPVGLGKDSNMPVGLQIIGRAFDEKKIIGIADTLERALPRIGLARG